MLNEMAKPRYHHFGVLRSTTELILSVTVPGVWPGATTGGLYGFGSGASIMLRPFLVLRVRMLGGQRGVRIRDLRQVGRARTRVQHLQQAVVERVGLPLRHFPVRIVDVAEHDGLRRAGLLAGGLERVGQDRPALDL